MFYCLRRRKRDKITNYTGKDMKRRDRNLRELRRGTMDKLIFFDSSGCSG